MRTITIKKTLYTFDELSEEAKECARENYSTFIWNDGEMHESMQMIADGILEDAGLSGAGNLRYNLYQQGGYPAFATSGPIEHGGEKYEFDYDSSQQVTLWNADGEDLDDIWDRDREKFSAVYQAVRDRIWKLRCKMYAAMIAEDESATSNEALSEVSEANGWEYDARGNLA